VVEHHYLLCMVIKLLRNNINMQFECCNDRTVVTQQLWLFLLISHLRIHRIRMLIVTI
jgi:hypothetical protein